MVRVDDRFVGRLAVCLALAGLTACAAGRPSRPDLRGFPEIQSEYRVEVLRGRLQEYSVTFAADVELAATSIEQRTADPAIRRHALLWRLRAIPEMRKACFRPEPVAALIDAWTLARQMERLVSTGAGASAFGPFQREVVEVSGRLVAQIRAIAESISVSPQARDQLEHNAIDPWLAAYPLRDFTFVRESPIARFMDSAQDRGGTLQSVGSMDETLASLSQQTRIYLADLPRQVRGEVDLLRADVMPPEDLSGLWADLRLTAAAADRVASTVVDVPKLVREERRAVLDEIQRLQALVMAGISGEREMTVSALTGVVAAERDLVLRDVESQRLATLEWATTQQHAVIAVMRQELAAATRALRDERVAGMNDVRGIVDEILIRLALFVGAAVVLAPLVAHIYARVWPRRWRTVHP